MPHHRTFWLTDVSAVPATERRLALYVLQLLQGAPDLKPRFQDPDFLGALWQLLRPVLHPRTVASFVSPPDDADDERPDDGDAETAQPQHDRWLRQRLRQCFQTVPRRGTTTIPSFWGHKASAFMPRDRRSVLVAACPDLDRSAQTGGDAESSTD